LLKIESIQKAINEQFHELSASVGQAIAQIQGAGTEFVKQSDTLQNEADKVASRFEDVGFTALAKTTQLGEASRKTVLDTELMVKSVQREAEGLLERANESLFELKKAGDSFAIRAREVAEQMKASLGTSEKYGRELRSQAGMVSEASGQAVEQLGKSLAVLKSKMDDVGQAAGDVGLRVERSREKLSGESERLLSVSTAALEAAKDAAFTFSKQSESLFKASQDAAQFAEDINKKNIRVEREGFMSSAKFIIESLHSLSVDLTRMSDGEISEKTWKAFQKGDVGAFTRRLVAMEGKMPLEKARDKFTKDTEFRTYVQRFIRQYEEMYEQARDNDHGALLSSTLASSEVGKLYDFLCSVAGKDSVIDRTALRAA
jgi:hypothetical protein